MDRLCLSVSPRDESFKSECCVMRSRSNHVHKPTYVGGNLIKCDGCGDNLTVKIILERLVIDKINEIFQCKKCDEIFVMKSDLKRHSLTHDKDIKKRFKCDECKKYFLWESQLKIHLRFHTGEKPFSCAECHKSFATKSNLKTHLHTHLSRLPLDFGCKECKKYFTTKFELMKHEKIHAKEKKLKCEKCDKYFRKRKYLRRHKKIHHGEKQFKCADCNKSFAHKCKLRHHVRIHTGEKRFKCKKCSQCFSCRNYLKIHQTTHSGGRNFKCEECNKYFTQKSSLNRHMKIHTVGKTFQCGQCKKYFSRNYHLRRHEEYHCRKKFNKSEGRENWFTNESHLKDFLRKFLKEENILSLHNAKNTTCEKEENSCQQSTENVAPVEDVRVQQADSTQQVTNRQEEMAKVISQSTNSSYELQPTQLLPRAEEENSNWHLTEKEVPMEDVQVQQVSTQKVSSPPEEITNVISQSPFSLTNSSHELQLTQLLSRAEQENSYQQSAEHEIPIGNLQVQEESMQQVSSPRKEITNVISQLPLSPANSSHESQATQVLSPTEEKNISQQSTENEVQTEDVQVQHDRMEQVGSPQEEITNVISQSPFSMTNSPHESQNIQQISQVEEEHSYSSQQSRENEVLIEDDQVEENSTQQVTDWQDEMAGDISQSPSSLSNSSHESQATQLISWAGEENGRQLSAEHDVPTGDVEVQQNCMQQITSPRKEIANEISQVPSSSHELQATQEESSNSTENEVSIVDMQVQQNITQQVTGRQEEIVRDFPQSLFSLANSSREFQTTQLLSQAEEENTSQQSIENKVPIGDEQSSIGVVPVVQNSMQQVTSQQKENQNSQSTNVFNESPSTILLSRAPWIENSSQQSRENEVPFGNAQVQQRSPQQRTIPQNEITNVIWPSPLSLPNFSYQSEAPQLLYGAPWSGNISQQSTGTMIPVGHVQFQPSSMQQFIFPQSGITNMISSSPFSFRNFSCEAQATQPFSLTPWKENTIQQPTENQVSIGGVQFQQSSAQLVCNPQKKITAVILQSPFSINNIVLRTANNSATFQGPLGN